MQSAVPNGLGAMAAVMKVAVDKLEAHCEAVSKENSSVEVANYNSQQQLVVAGHDDAVTRLCDVLVAEKARATRLPVSAPFHSRLMKPAKK